MDDQLGISVTLADGSIRRWAPDEFDPGDIPTGLEFSSSVPGGYKSMSCDLLRRIDLDYPDLNLLDSIRVYGAGNETVWEGRIVQLPRSHGDGYQIVPGAVGWSSHLQDDPTLMEVYGDADPASWQEPGLDRRIALAALNYPQAHYSASSSPVIAFNGEAGTQIPINANASLMYYAPTGVTVAKLGYRGSEYNVTNVEAAKLYTDDNVAHSSPASVALTLDNTLRTATVTTPERYGLVWALATATHTPAAGVPFSRIFKRICVYGNHGLTLHSIDSSTPDGMYASDMVADVLSRWAPLLTYSTGAGGSIEATTLPIPHMAFKEPTDASTAIQTINASHLYEWGVYDNREFFYRQTDPDRLCWEARLSEGARVDLEGDQADDVYNGVFVSYTDFDGQKKTVGPTGATADATDSTLGDTDPANPVNAHGIPRKWAKLEITAFPTYLAGATAIGAAWLAERSLPQRRGTITLKGSCKHPTQGERPVSRMRAGDYIRIADHPTDVPRRIIETSYDHDQRTMTLTCDNSANKVDSILERIGVIMTGMT